MNKIESRRGGMTEISESTRGIKNTTIVNEKS